MSRLSNNKFWRLAAALALSAVVAAACQPAPAAPASPEVGEVTRVVAGTPETVVITATAPPAEPAGPVTLTTWNYLIPENYPQIEPIYEAFDQEFMAAHPDVTLEHVAVPYEGSDAKYAAAFAGRSGAPDIFIGKVPYLAGGLGVADPAPDDVAECWDANAVDVIKPYLQYEGQYYGFPLETDLGMMLYWNKGLFREAGLDPEVPPTNMDELLEYAQKLTKTDAAGNVTQIGFAVRYSGNPRGVADKWLPFLHAWGGELYAPDESTSEGYLNSPEAIESLQFYGDLVNTYKVASVSLGRPDDVFPKGQAAMFFREAWFVGIMRDTAPDIEYGVAPLPEKSANPGFSLLFQDAYMVYKFSPNKDLAWEWVKGVTCNPDISIEQAKATGTLPTFKEFFETDPYLTERPDYQAELEILNNPTSPYYGAPYINEISFRVGQAIQEVMFNEKTAEQALNDAVGDVDTILAKGQ
jgi:multiple sugar transport system substrate-binding protein